MESMMSGLFERGRLDILRGIQSGEYSPLQVWDAYRSNELERLPTAATLAPLKETMTAWLAKKECSEAHRRSLSQSLRHLLVASKSSATVGNLPTLVATVRERFSGTHPRSFNIARSAAQAFVKATLKRSHPIYSAITDIEPLRVTAVRKGRPLTVDEMVELTAKFKIRRHASTAWAMALTGMGPSEYWGRWHILSDRIHIDGTKRQGRVRDVPLIRRIATPYASPAAFAEALEHLGGIRVTPYDFRRTYANWLETAEIPRTRRMLYMGHGNRDVTDHYERHEVAAYLSGDAEKLKALIGATEIPVLTVEKRA
jgi:integrase